MGGGVVVQKAPLPELQNSHFTSDSDAAFSLSLFSFTSKTPCGMCYHEIIR